MSLVLGDSTLAGLRVASEQENLPQLAAAAAQAATAGRTEDSLKVTGAAAKSAFAAILTLLFEAARGDALPADITPVLEQAGWPSTASTQLLSLYSERKDALRGSSTAAAAPTSSAVPSLSSLSSTAFPSVIGVSWRVDDYIKSDTLDALRQPSFLLELQAQGPASTSRLGGAAEQAADSGVQRIPFTCNFQQMQDLLAKLKDAQKQIQQRVE